MPEKKFMAKVTFTVSGFVKKTKGIDNLRRHRMQLNYHLLGHEDAYYLFPGHMTTIAF